MKKIVTTVRFHLTLDVEINSSSKGTLTMDRVHDEAVSSASSAVDAFIRNDGVKFGIKRGPGMRVVHLATETEA